MVRKLFASLVLLVCASLSAVAELYPSKRFFELGVDMGIVATQNLMPIDEIMRKNLVINLTKIYSGMGDDGFLLTAGVSPELSFAMNFRRWGLGITAGMEASASFGLGRDFFKLLGEGNSIGDNKVSVNLAAQVFADVAAPFAFSLGDFKIHVTPSYFLPLLYVPAPDAYVNVSISESGKITTSLNVPIDVYTLVGGAVRFDDGGASVDAGAVTSDAIMEELLASGGVDLATLVEYPIHPTLDLGTYVRVPVLPGHLHHRVSARAHAEAEVSSVMDMVNGDSSFETPDIEYDDTEYSDDANYTVNRSFRTGVEAAWRPCGKWLTVRPSLGLAVRNPFGNDFSKENVYMEYGLGVDVTCLYMFGFNFKMEYTDQMFANTFGFALNFRVVELDFALSTSSAEFLKSWAVYGLQAKLGLRVGF